MEKITKHLPIISALLIFIGYLNYQFYYSRFDIEIDSFLTTSELIFSFLPLTVPFLLIIVLLIFFFLGILSLAFDGRVREHGDNDGEKSLHAISSVWTAWALLVNDIRKKNWIALPGSILVFLLGIAITVLMFGYIVIFMEASIGDQPSDISYEGIFLLGIIWMLFIFIKIDAQKDEAKKIHFRKFAYVLLITHAIGLLRIANKESAIAILKGTPIYNASIELENSTITTDTILVYIGKTSNYIFLRDRKNDSNIILNATEVRKFILTKAKLKEHSR